MQTVRRHLRLIPAGTVFTPAELVAKRIGSSDAIRKTLTRLVGSGEIQRIRKGYYMRPPLKTKSLNKDPSVEAIARAYARKIAARQIREERAS
jgi:hypothetical protein